MGIQVEGVTYRYADGGIPITALDNITAAFRPEAFTAVIGPSGSGKSTLMQLLNGLLIPSEGVVRVMDVEIGPGTKEKTLYPVRRRVGLVFQYPERQLFEESVLQDLCFGPLNFGLSAIDAEAAARSAASRLGLTPEILASSPFRLSSGQQRKAAIAAVLAAQPDVVVLDEPTASLDPSSRRELMEQLSELCKKDRKTMIVVTHRLEEVLPYADDLVVMHEGKLIYQGPVDRLAADAEVLSDAGLTLPPSVTFLGELAADAKDGGGPFVPDHPVDAAEAAARIAAWLSEGT